jgi:hypothetical protein
LVRDALDRRADPPSPNARCKPSNVRFRADEPLGKCEKSHRADIQSSNIAGRARASAVGQKRAFKLSPRPRKADFRSAGVAVRKLRFGRALGDLQRQMPECDPWAKPNEGTACAHSCSPIIRVCIYCAQRSQTVEHMPPVIMFTRKQRPKGLEFASCEACNGGTKHADLVAAYIGRSMM